MNTGIPAVIVTGASRGIGAAVARLIGATGAGVTIVARSADALDQTATDVAAVGGDALVMAADLARPNVAQRIVSATVQQWGRLDGLVNNAATLEPMRRVYALDFSHWEEALRLNVAAAAALTGAALPALRATRGRVVNLSSSAATLAIAGLGPYCVSKAALTHFTRVVAAEEPTITVLNFQPGHVDTGMHVALRTDTHGALEVERRTYFEQLPVDGELQSPDVPGRSVAWLVLSAPATWSGEELRHDDPRIPVTSR